MKLKLYILSVLLPLISYLLSPIFLPSIYAQQVSLSFTPPLVETIIKPGKSILLAYTLKNSGDPITTRFLVRSFRPKGDNGEITIDNEALGPVRFQLDNSDLQLDQPFLLKSQESKQAVIRIRIASGAPEGDYYYTVLAQTQPQISPDGTVSSQAKATIASTLLITVSETGVTHITAHIDSFSIKPRYTIQLGTKKYLIVDSNDKIPVSLIVKNSSDSLIKPVGTIKINGSFGSKYSYPIMTQNILAQSSRRLKFDNPATTQEEYQTYSGYINGFFLGIHTLTAEISFGENTPQIYSSVTFIGIPFKFAAGFSIVLFVTLLLYFLIRKPKQTDVDE